jgi:hypothetical protein
VTRQNEKVVILFSGGVDSRLTAAAFKAAGANPLLLTLGDAKNLEARVAEQAAKAMGLDHVIILRDPEWYLRSLPKAIFETGGTFVWTHGHFSEAVSKIQQDHRADAFLLGDFCEAFSKLLCADELGRSSIWTPEEFVREFDRTRPPLYRPKARARTLGLLNARIRREVEESLAHDIERRFERLCDISTDPRILVDQFARSNSAATISTFYMFLDVRSRASERNLMFDADVHELLETLPARVRERANLGALLVKRLAPRAARVVNSNSLLPICWPLAAHRLTKRCKPILGKARRFVLGNSHRTTGAWPEKAALYVTNENWRRSFEAIVEDGDLFPDDIFDLAQVRECWRALVNGQKDRAADIEKLVQFGLLRRFSLGLNCCPEKITCVEA